MMPAAMRGRILERPEVAEVADLGQAAVGQGVDDQAGERGRPEPVVLAGGHGHRAPHLGEVVERVVAGPMR